MDLNLTQHQETNICSHQPANSVKVVLRNADGTYQGNQLSAIRCLDAYYSGGNMSHVTLGDVQKILGLNVTYPYFEKWDEKFSFDVAGVNVTAVVTHSYRSETIKICQPFTVEGSAYGFRFEPPLFALNASFAARNTTLKTSGLTEHDFWLKNAQKLCLFHSIYLKNKPEIDIAQREYLNKFGDQLAMVQYKSTIANEQFRLSRSTLRQMLREGTIAQREYQQNLATFRAEMNVSLSEFHQMQNDVNRELHTIKMGIIERYMQ